MSISSGSRPLTLKQMVKHVGDDAESRLRDLFAGRALGLFPLSDQNLAALQNGRRPNHALVARFCYDAADALIAERKKRLRRK